MENHKDKLADLKKFYDEHPSYIALRDEESFRLKEYKIEVEFKIRNLTAVIPDGLRFKSILEIGCANGYLLNKIAQKLQVEDITGIDISSENIAYAKEKYDNINFFCGTIEEFIRSNVKTFDLVILSDIIEHVPNDFDFLSTVKNISKYTVINLPLEKTIMNRNRKYGYSDHSGHLRAYNYTEALDLIDTVGYKRMTTKKVIAIRDDKKYFKIEKEKQRQLRKQMNVFNKIKSGAFLIFRDNIISYNSFLYSKLFTHNLFCFVQK